MGIQQAADSLAPQSPSQEHAASPVTAILVVERDLRHHPLLPVQTGGVLAAKRATAKAQFPVEFL